ncbi:MAG TPA: MarR family transcriptional regulator [Candidatus Copromorpha excrementigallinarum]|uniref:MarR family transcriptional regulator n=1 Tax=Candidatus Allocopromorpha excrementigallinarum TaxID=2840742 RepID=A0A9D1I0Y2_9FIRM|nr:MarR family transcriptional regulator [Candidatus Copromorpha excrementigallinarum]
MERDTKKLLTSLNLLYKEMDEIYHNYAKRSGISNTALWIMYSICEKEEPSTQRELAAEWHYPPQTVNSVLKSFEKDGYIMLVPVPGNQKSKAVVLTEKGRAFAERVVYPMMLAEERALGALTEKEQKAFLSIVEKYVDILKAEISRI